MSTYTVNANDITNLHLSIARSRIAKARRAVEAGDLDLPEELFEDAQLLGEYCALLTVDGQRNVDFPSFVSMSPGTIDVVQEDEDDPSDQESDPT